MSNLFFTSDTDWGHQKIIEYCNRPFDSVGEMDEQLIRRWNDTVKPNDTVWHLGDFFFCDLNRVKEILKQLNGNIHCCLGNHDKIMVNSGPLLLKEGLIKEQVQYKELKYDKKFVVLSHYSHRVWNRSHYPDSYMLFGHSHDTLEPHGRSVDVGVDSKWVNGVAGYRPFAWEEIKSFMSSREVINTFE